MSDTVTNDQQAPVVGTKKAFSIPRRINQGGRERLIDKGVDFVEGDHYQYFSVQIPCDWTLRPTTVSVWQYRLYDGAGNLIAQVFYKPTAGTPSINVFLTDDEANAMEPA